VYAVTLKIWSDSLYQYHVGYCPLLIILQTIEYSVRSNDLFSDTVTTCKNSEPRKSSGKEACPRAEILTWDLNEDLQLYIYFIFASHNDAVNSSDYIQDAPGGKIDVLGGHCIGHSKKNYTCACVIFPTVSEIELFHCTVHCALYRRATRHVLTRAAKCIDVDGGIFENVLH
jgi:hypothetical protein